jgi:hypothetical protein
MEPKKIYTEKDQFLSLYFYYLETILNQDNSGLSKIKFQSEESNTDEYLKKYFKKFIKDNNHLQNIPNKKCIFEIDGKREIVSNNKFNDYKIVDVLIPEELTQEQKNKISETKTSIYTNPDLYLMITNGKEFWSESVELKSTKVNQIPGSSIQQVSPYEWVIFVKRSETNTEVTIGHYINCITDKLPFPDRSPRPLIGYVPLKEWNNENRFIIENVFNLKINTKEHIEKLKILEDWQDYLASKWIEIINKNSTKNSEAWFNNAIRKYTLKVLDLTKNMTPKEIETLYLKIRNMIK